MALLRRRSVLILWGAAFLAVYAILLRAPAAYDDQAYIFNNPLVTGPWPGLGAFLLGGGPAGGPGYEPLPMLGHRLLHLLAGQGILLYRLSSLLLHALNCLLIWRVYRRLLDDSDLALAAAALFSLFPAHVEVLALSAFKTHLAVASCALLILELQERQAGAAWRRAGCWAALCAALLCKESALVIPPLALLVDGLRPAPRKRDGVLLGGLFGLAALYVVLRLCLLPPRLQDGLAAGLGGRLLTAAEMLVWYARQMAWPQGLCLEHSLAPVLSWREPGAGLFLAAAAALLAPAVWLRRWDRVAWTGWVWAGLALAPFLNLVPYFNFSLVADRYLYLASAGFFLCLARAAERFSQPRGEAAASRACLAAGLLAAGYCAVGLRHAALFTDPLKLWEETVRCAPANPRARAALGAQCSARGLHERAVEELVAAIRLDPGYLEPYLDLGAAYARMGRFDDAVAVARRRVALRPDAEGWLNLGAFLLDAGRFEEALAPLQRAVELAPGDADARSNLELCRSRLRERGTRSRYPRSRARDGGK